MSMQHTLFKKLIFCRLLKHSKTEQKSDFGQWRNVSNKGNGRRRWRVWSFTSTDNCWNSTKWSCFESVFLLYWLFSLIDICEIFKCKQRKNNWFFSYQFYVFNAFCYINTIFYSFLKNHFKFFLFFQSVPLFTQTLILVILFTRKLYFKSSHIWSAFKFSMEKCKKEC